jgi:hypothetical protein
MEKDKNKENILPTGLENMEEQLNKASQAMSDSMNYITKVIEEKMAMFSDDLPVKKELSKLLGKNK